MSAPDLVKRVLKDGVWGPGPPIKGGSGHNSLYTNLQRADQGILEVFADGRVRVYVPTIKNPFADLLPNEAHTSGYECQFGACKKRRLEENIPPNDPNRWCWHIDNALIVVKQTMKLERVRKSRFPDLAPREQLIASAPTETVADVITDGGQVAAASSGIPGEAPATQVQLVERDQALPSRHTKRSRRGTSRPPPPLETRRPINFVAKIVGKGEFRWEGVAKSDSPDLIGYAKEAFPEAEVQSVTIDNWKGPEPAIDAILEGAKTLGVGRTHPVDAILAEACSEWPDLTTSQRQHTRGRFSQVIISQKFKRAADGTWFAEPDPSDGRKNCYGVRQ